MDNLLIKLILGLGYILAVPPLLSIIPGFRKSSRHKPSNLVLGAEVAGTAFIVIGWISLGNWLAVLVNGTWLVFMSIFWWRKQSSG